MLYIENIDDCNFRMYGTNISKTGVKVFSKTGFLAKAIEPAYNEVTGRICIYDSGKDEKLLNHKEVSGINLDGIVYATAEAFVVAFNNLMAECCCSGSGGGSGDYTELIDTIENYGDSIITILNRTISCECNNCNDWSIGTAEGESVTFDTNTIHSITIIVESGTVNVSNGTENADLIEGESVTYTAEATLNQAITIDATSGKAIYAIITCTATTTTTTVEQTTTTTVECDFQEIGTEEPDYVLEFPSFSPPN
jgi:hypothetical protein